MRKCHTMSGHWDWERGGNGALDKSSLGRSGGDRDPTATS